MDKDTLINLFHHHYWANRRVWNATMALSDQQFTQAPKDASASVQAQLAGMVANENLWVNYLWHGEVEFLDVAQLPTRASIRAEWDALEEEVLDFIDELSPGDLMRLVEPPFLTAGVALKVWEILLHIVQHGVECRALLCAHLRLVGLQPPAHDLFAHAVETAAHPVPHQQFAVPSLASVSKR